MSQTTHLSDSLGHTTLQQRIDAADGPEAPGSP